jgi:uncharacterized delta-60 repeat protein
MRNKFKILGSCLLLIGLLLFLPTVNAAPGDLDTSFSQDGKLFDYFIGGYRDQIHGTAIQTDGKIVAVGQSSFGSITSCGISRYNTDGTLDPTFDGDGKAIIPSGRMFICRAVAIQADGKIVAAGNSNIGNIENYDFTLVRYNPNGSLDTSFDSDGMVITALGDFNDIAYAVAIQTDDKIVVAGSSDSTSHSDFAVVRYNTDGSLDASFDADGKVITQVGAITADVAFDMTIQPDGKIVAAGSSANKFAVVRYNTDGSLDASFDSDGKAITQVHVYDAAYAVAIQPDGKIVAAGTSAIPNSTSPLDGHQDFSLVRYNTDGSLDTSFDSDGKVITTIPATSEFAHAVAIQSDGKIVIDGYSNNRSNYKFALARYNANGSLDTSFDSDGIIITPFFGTGDIVNALAIQPDGKIIASGTSLSDFALVRYNSNGSLDSSFSSDGKTNNDVGFLISSAGATTIQPDGKIVVAGYSQNAEGNDFAVSRYNSDGSPDLSFGSDGKVITVMSNDSDEARAVAIQPNGKIVVAGVTGMPFNSYNSADIGVVRYNTNGSLDTSFDSDGKVILDFSVIDFANAVAIQADGKIVVAGSSVLSISVGSHIALLRFNTDGSLDTSFDSDGKVTTTVLNGSGARAVAIQPDGKIVAAGFSSNGTNWDFSLVRYNTNGSLDTSFDSDGKLTTPVLSGDDEARAVAIQTNGKIIAAGFSNNGFSNNDFSLVRYNSNGSLDTTFNADGKVTFDFWGSSNDILYGMARDSAGRVVVVGEASGNFAVARVLGELAPNAKTPFDFDGDGRADIAVFRPTGQGDPNKAYFYVQQSQSGSFRAEQFGREGDVPVPADYDGDLKTDFAVWRASDKNFYILNSFDNTFRVENFGLSGDITTGGDWDGDGKADPAVYRSGTQSFFYYRGSMGNPQGNITAIAWGVAGDKPVAGDYDGDGLTDAAVYRNGYWFIRQSLNGQLWASNFGLANDKLVPADYDGDGKTDIGVYRGGIWYLLRSAQGFGAVQFGASNDTPAPADYDGDGKSDPAVYRDNTWYLLRSANGFTGMQFGATDDKPIPSAFVR